MRKIIIFVLSVLSTLNLYSQMSSDRPGYSDPPQIVGKGKIQWENGFDFIFFNQNIKNNEINYFNSLIRFGISDFSEFRLSLSYKNLEDNSIILQGISDLALGMKLKINESEISFLPSSSLIMTLNLPYGSENFKPDKIEPNLVFVFENPLSDNFALGYNIGLNWNSSEVSYIYSLSISYNIHDNLNVTFGGLSELQQNNSPIQYIETAIAYLLFDNFQIDLWTSYTPFQNQKQNFVGLGFSWLMN